MMQFYFILSLIMSILIIIFAIMNGAAVPVRFFFVEYQLSLALIIFLSAALGSIITVLLGLVKHFKEKRQIKLLQLENKELKSGKERLEKDIALLKEVTEKTCEEEKDESANNDIS